MPPRKVNQHRWRVNIFGETVRLTKLQAIEYHSLFGYYPQKRKRRPDWSKRGARVPVRETCKLWQEDDVDPNKWEGYDKPRGGHSMWFYLPDTPPKATAAQKKARQENIDAAAEETALEALEAAHEAKKEADDDAKEEAEEMKEQLQGRFDELWEVVQTLQSDNDEKTDQIEALQASVDHISSLLESKMGLLQSELNELRSNRSSR